MPNWTPGTQDGKPVSAKYIVPFTFLDGKPISAEELNNISSDIIESMDILKDDENISKYIGQYAEAKNGVCLFARKDRQIPIKCNFC